MAPARRGGLVLSARREPATVTLKEAVPEDAEVCGVTDGFS
jgi:hypothetical protein